MRLRNKKTGEIIDLTEGHICETECGKYLTLRPVAVLNKEYNYNSLAELNEEWEDLDEPKEYCYITGRGNLHFIEDIDDEGDKERKQIGNYFETEEEAEKAVEKLKAVKRLKDNKFRFTGYKDNTNPKGNSYQIIIEAIFDGASFDDLDLLFGGEE